MTTFTKEHLDEHARVVREALGLTEAPEVPLPYVHTFNEDAEADLEHRFTYHPTLEGRGQVERYRSIRARAAGLAVFIRCATPGGREQALALTKLEECVMWANAAIARGER